MFGMILPLIGMDDNVRKIFYDPRNGEFIYYLPKELACTTVGYCPIAFVRTERSATRFSRMTNIKETNPIEINADNNQIYEELFGKNNQQKFEMQRIEEKRIRKNKYKNENKRIKQEIRRRK